MKDEPINDEELTRWIDGELEDDALAEFEKRSDSLPELAEQKRDAGALGQLLRSNFSPEIEPPNADFFNSRVQQAIRVEAGAADEKVVQGSFGKWWKSPWLVAAAAVVMAAFVMLDRPSNIAADVAHSSLTNTYTPHAKVVLNTYYSEDAGATVIELEGFEVPTDREITGQSVASYEPGDPGSALTFYSADDAELPLFVMLKDSHNNPIVYEVPQ